MDVGMITNTTSAAANTHATNTFAAKETKQSDDVKKYNVTGRTIGQPKLSEEAKQYYEQLKSKYQDMDFILVSKDMKETAKASAGSFANPHKMVVLIDEEQQERLEEQREENRKAQEALNSENIQDLFGEYKKDDVVIVSAGSVDELLRKVEEYNFSYRADMVKTQAEKYVGTVIDFKG